MGINLELVLAVVILAGFLAVNVVMFISLGKQGDERRRLIIEKASAGTFAVMVVYILFCVIEGIYQSVARGVPTEGMNPFITLTVSSIIYSAHMLYYRRKFGD